MDKLFYGSGVVSIPSSALPKLRSARKNDIIVLLELAADMSAETAVLAERCGLSEAAVESSLGFWRGAGIMIPDQDEAGNETAAEELDPAETKRREKEQAEFRKIAAQPPAYTSEEVAKLIDADPQIASMLDECQQLLGRIFGQTDNMRIVSVMNYFGLNPEYMLLVAAHCAAIGKQSVGYLVQSVTGLCSRGISDVDSLNEYLMAIAKTATLETKLRALFGINRNRQLTEKESKCFSAWSGRFGYDIDVITMAYNITVDTTKEPSVPYANAILDKWYSLGLKTAADVEKYLEDEAAKGVHGRGGRGSGSGAKTAADPFGGKSFDSDDFFERSLLKSYGSAELMPEIAVPDTPDEGRNVVASDRQKRQTRKK